MHLRKTIYGTIIFNCIGQKKTAEILTKISFERFKKMPLNTVLVATQGENLCCIISVAMPQKNAAQAPPSGTGYLVYI